MHDDVCQDVAAIQVARVMSRQPRHREVCRPLVTPSTATVTVKFDGGYTDVVSVSPEMKRLDEVKTGAVDHREDRGRQHRDAQGKRSEEPRWRVARRPDRHYLHRSDSPGGFVETDRIIGDRSSTDFGMYFGGVNFGHVYAELRYHYIWGPKFEAPVEAVNFSGDLKANGKFFLTTCPSIPIRPGRSSPSRSKPAAERGQGATGISHGCVSPASHTRSHS